MDERELKTIEEKTNENERKGIDKDNSNIYYVNNNVRIVFIEVDD